jgi:hypothetical protein
MTFQPRTCNCGVNRDGNHWAPYCQLDVWLIMNVWDFMDQTPLQSTVLCPVIFITLDHLSAQSKPSLAIRHLTLNVSVSGYKTLGQIWQKLKNQHWIHGGLVCTVCYNVPCIHQIQNKVLGVKVFVTQFLYSFACLSLSFLGYSTLAGWLRLPSLICFVPFLNDMGTVCSGCWRHFLIFTFLL